MIVKKSISLFAFLICSFYLFSQVSSNKDTIVNDTLIIPFKKVLTGYTIEKLLKYIPTDYEIVLINEQRVEIPFYLAKIRGGTLNFYTENKYYSLRAKGKSVFKYPSNKNLKKEDLNIEIKITSQSDTDFSSYKLVTGKRYVLRVDKDKNIREIVEATDTKD
jgi:hypothetical protein